MLQKFSRSLQAFKQLKTVVFVGLLAAAQMILELVAVMPLPWMKISFGFVALGVCGMLFGPAVCAAQAVIVDILGVLLFPKGPYFPGFTLSALLSGLVYGFLLYQEKITWPRLFWAKGIVNLFVNLLLGTLWASMMQGKAFAVLLPLRALKNALLLPLEVAVLWAALQGVLRSKLRP